MSTPAYDYIPRLRSPRSVEFYTKTLQGHRKVIVHLDSSTPRVIAINESSSDRSPATLWFDELLTLVLRAYEVCDLDSSLFILSLQETKCKTKQSK